MRVGRGNHVTEGLRSLLRGLDLIFWDCGASEGFCEQDLIALLCYLWRLIWRMRGPGGEWRKGRLDSYFGERNEQCGMLFVRSGSFAAGRRERRQMRHLWHYFTHRRWSEEVKFYKHTSVTVKQNPFGRKRNLGHLEEGVRGVELKFISGMLHLKDGGRYKWQYPVGSWDLRWALGEKRGLEFRAETIWPAGWAETQAETRSGKTTLYKRWGKMASCFPILGPYDSKTIYNTFLERLFMKSLRR